MAKGIDLFGPFAGRQDPFVRRQPRRDVHEIVAAVYSERFLEPQVYEPIARAAGTIISQEVALREAPSAAGDSAILGGAEA